MNIVKLLDFMDGSTKIFVFELVNKTTRNRLRYNIDVCDKNAPHNITLTVKSIR